MSEEHIYDDTTVFTKVVFICYSDAMETDDKAGSSPAGKPTETVSFLQCLIN